MKHRSLFIFCLIFGAAGITAAQTRSVTNADLELYKQARIKADREYRENYARMGFPSPEELERRREQSRLESEQLSAKLRGERLERERVDAERQVLEQPQDRYVIVDRDQYYTDPIYSPYYRANRRRPSIIRSAGQTGYFAGGQFWPTGPRTRSRPMWVPARRN